MTLNTATLLEKNLLEKNLLATIRDLIPFQLFLWKGKKSILTLAQKFGETCITTYNDNSSWDQLANCSTLRIWAALQKVIQSVPTLYLTKK